MNILARLTHLERTLKMVQSDVALVQADVAALKTKVKSIQAEVNDLLVKQGAAIDAEDLTAIKAIHDDLNAVNAALDFTISQDPLLAATPVSPAA